MRIDIKLQDILLILFGTLSGASIQLNKIANNDQIIALGVSEKFSIISNALIFTIILWLLRRTIRKVVSKASLPELVKDSFKRYDTLTYGVFLLPLLGAFGFQFSFSIALLMIFSFISFQLFLLFLSFSVRNKERFILSPHWLSFLFIFSGFAALIYQIVWQRVLFTAFGVNIESITVIVSVFMFGLGIGSLAGGLLSKKYPAFLPHIFLVCEICIGLFGAISLPLIKWVSDATYHESILSLSITTYALLSLPTMLMGATLPVLVAYIHNHIKNIGVSVGTLYSLNTIGSAIACFITVELFFVLFGQQTTVLIAALFNFGVGILVYLYTKRLPQQKIVDEIKINPEIMTDKKDFVHFLLVLLLSAFIGYISLSQEILWIRAISYATGGKPDVFGHVLGFFLFGIAFGALFATRICEKGKIQPITYIALILFISSIIYYFSFPLSGSILTVFENGVIILYFSVMGVSFLTGSIFPVLCHFGIKKANSVGISLSWIYFFNILGSTAGPLITVFLLLDKWGLNENILFLSITSLIFSGIIFFTSSNPVKNKILFNGAITIVIFVILFSNNDLYSKLLEKLHYKTEYLTKKPYKYLIQNRVGIISVEDSITDIIYGGGVYDGRFNIDPVLNTNGIRRAYMIASLHPNPEDVLEIGLSSGSWTWVLASHRAVKRLTVVEINPGYLEPIKKYPEHSTLLNNQKVVIHIDDGRRWLNRNPDKRFDLIVMNTTFHWRSHSTNLLSEEFLRICKNHLKPGGVIYYNATWSDDVVFTAKKVFKHITKYDNFVAASDSPFSMSYEERIKNLMKFENEGKTIFDKKNPVLYALLHDMASSVLPDISETIAKRKDLLGITDDNMATEFKRIYNEHKWKSFYAPEKNWLKLIQKG